MNLNIDKDYILREFKENKIEAIKYVREQTGLDLKSAMDIVNEILAEEITPINKSKKYKSEYFDFSDLEKTIERNKIMQNNNPNIPQNENIFLKIINIIFSTIGSTIIWAIALLMFIFGIFLIMYFLSIFGIIGLAKEQILPICIGIYLILVFIAFIGSFIGSAMGKDTSAPAANYISNSLDNMIERSNKDAEYRRKVRIQEREREKIRREKERFQKNRH